LVVSRRVRGEGLGVRGEGKRTVDRKQKSEFGR